MASVTMSNVRKAFGAFEVLHSVNLSVEDEEFVVLVGPSGCGKTTLLRMVAGLEEVTGGDISIGETIVNELAPRDRDIAMVFQSYALYPRKTVYANMAFSMKLRGLPKTEIDRKVKEAAQSLGLTQLLDRYPRQLSGGQRQRVAMGRAIVRDPKVFLFDEPLSNLDAKLRVHMRTELKRLHQRLRTTSIYVTHDQIEAMTMADRIVVMRDGKIEQIGAPREVYRNPANIFVAGFIGSPAMNFLSGTLRRDAVSLSVDLPDGKSLSLRPEMAGEHGQPVTVGVRPEHVELKPAGMGLETRLEVLEPTGAEVHVTTSIGGVVFTAILHDNESLKTGQNVHLGFNPDWIRLFDPATGRALTR